jgi:bifunctional UDP-N-acetylglucosamine pyrophosphorylase / glucosamine-1-phosphate N-acetyltransferase
MAGNDLAVVILAAGKGTRLKSRLAKVLHRAGGHSLVEHVIAACAPLKARKIVAVVGHQADQVSPLIQPRGVEGVLQQPQRGTGHAVQVARRALGGAKIALVLPGDAPLIRTDTLRSMIAAHRAANAAATILTAVVSDPSGYGRILRKSETTVQAIVEESQLSDEQRDINEINSSIYCFTLEKLWPALALVKPNNKHRELYLTDAVSVLASKNETVLAHLAADPREALGCNTRADLAEVDRIFRERKRAALMNEGVSILLPETVLIDSDVIVGEDSVVEPCAQLLGKTKIGQRCTIGTGSVLSDMILGDDVLVRPHCVAMQSRLDDNAVIGPFTHLRSGAHLKDGARAGNFAEIKKSAIGEGAKVPHLTYVGDAQVGAKTNIGAGTITCNYDGFQKHPTSIGRGVFIGSNATLVAPVRIGDGAYVAAGSTITENVPPDGLGIARGRQVNKPHWASRKRRKLSAAVERANTRPRSRKKSKARKRKSRRRR